MRLGRSMYIRSRGVVCLRSGPYYCRSQARLSTSVHRHLITVSNGSVEQSYSSSFKHGDRCVRRSYASPLLPTRLDVISMVTFPHPRPRRLRVVSTEHNRSPRWVFFFTCIARLLPVALKKTRERTRKEERERTQIRVLQHHQL
jgi:hypothetical protein